MPRKYKAQAKKRTGNGLGELLARGTLLDEDFNLFLSEKMLPVGTQLVVQFQVGAGKNITTRALTCKITKVSFVNNQWEHVLLQV